MNDFDQVEQPVTLSMPNSLEAEQSVIGAMITDTDAINSVSEFLLAEDFYHKQYALMFEVITELYDASVPIDVVTLQDALKKKNAPEEITNPGFIAGLSASVPITVNVESYAKIVKDKATLRNIIRTAKEISDEAYSQEANIETVMNTTEQRLLALLQSQGAGEYVPIDEIVMNALNRIEAASKMDGDVTGIPTGFLDLDAKTAGLQNSDLILIAARPSMGKTAFVLNIAEYVAFHEDECVAVFSLEMSKEQLVNRLFSLESHVDSEKIRSGDLSESDWEKLMEGAAVVGQSKLIIDGSPGMSISELRSKCRKYKQEKDLKLIMIDYLQLMTGSGRSESHQQMISEISRSLKGLARELDVPVIALSQLNRNVEQREDKRPMLSDLRDSGAIEQDADVVMFIYRDDYYNKDSARKGISEIIIAKQRNGPVGTVDLAWLPEYTKFANLERRHRD